MAAGLPIVAARSGGIPEMITHDESGLLTDPGEPAQVADAVERLLTDQQLSQRLANNSVARCSRDFGATDQIQAVLKVYGEVLGICDL